jgi:hypothetical protein
MYVCSNSDAEENFRSPSHSVERDGEGTRERERQKSTDFVDFNVSYTSVLEHAMHGELTSGFSNGQ